jgi:hypothetical protein
MSKTASDTEIQYTLTLITRETQKEINKLETSLMRIAGYIQRFSGNQDLNRTLELIQRAIVTLKSLQMAIRAVQLASGPIGWLYAGTSIVAAGMSGMAIFESTSGV